MQPITQINQGLSTPPVTGDEHPERAETLRPVDGRALRATSRINVEAEHVEKLPFDLSVLNEEGVFINVDAGGFGLLARQLDWNVLGITLPEDSSIAFHQPRIGILPNKYRLALQRPAAQAHQALNKWSYQFRLTESLFETSAYRWVPWNAFDQFEADFQAAVVALREAKRAALDDYDAIIRSVKETFTKLAEDSARRLESTTGIAVDPDFRPKIIEGALALVPSREDIEHKLTLRRRPGVMLLGSEMLAEQRAAAEERLRLETAQAETRVIQAEAQARIRRSQIELIAEEDRRREQRRFEDEERRREAQVKERIRQIKLDEARRRVQESLSPLTEGAAQLHAKIYEAALSMKESLANNEHVPGATAKRARELTRWFKLMNFQSDEELDKLLTELNHLTSRKAKDRAPAPIDNVLTDIIRATYEKATAAMETNRIDALEI